MASNLHFILLHLKCSNDKNVFMASIPFASMTDSFLTVMLAPFFKANSIASTKLLDVA